MIAVGEAAPALTGTTATGLAFELASAVPRPRSFLIEFHRGTW